MGISSALYSGVSGLNTNSQAMSVIGNNLANTNTIGFKGSRTVFADLLSSSINGSGGASQVGRGVGMSKVDQVFNQGTFESTESNLDVAIEGDGFFILKEEGNQTPFYSRAGAFRFNDEGYLINPEGYRVQGKEFDDIDNTVLKPGGAVDIQVGGTGLIQGQATTTMKLTTNLDSSETPPAVAPFLYSDPDTFNYSSSAQIFDSLGNPHLLTTYFVKTAAANTWNVSYSYEPEGAAVPTVATFAAPLVFNTDGVFANSLLDPPVPTTATTAALDFANGSNATETIQITFDTTQFNSESVVISQNQNGFGAGNLTGVAIDPNGIVVASYSNGKQTNIAQLVLGKFVNPNGLSLVGSNLYNETSTSGPARTGLPGPELGKVFTNSLEQSNVDMGAEFVRMITVQRGFQANSKIITTVDELLGELINLKR
ncbi:MAG: flagellar hook protein FlgE [Proteobacteria bacterium]|nr:flagellar hook protein FlgE [Pseudomonadota bacterium]